MHVTVPLVLYVVALLLTLLDLTASNGRHLLHVAVFLIALGLVIGLVS